MKTLYILRGKHSDGTICNVISKNTQDLQVVLTELLRANGSGFIYRK